MDPAVCFVVVVVVLSKGSEPIKGFKEAHNGFQHFSSS